jgi:hypothetical protein
MCPFSKLGGMQAIPTLHRSRAREQQFERGLGICVRGESTQPKKSFFLLFLLARPAAKRTARDAPDFVEVLVDLLCADASAGARQDRRCAADQVPRLPTHGRHIVMGRWCAAACRRGCLGHDVAELMKTCAHALPNM